MGSDYFKRVHKRTPTRMWINNVTREQARLAIEAGAQNCTQNPTYPWKILNDEKDGPAAKALLDELIRSGGDNESVLGEFQLRLIQQICDIFLPIHEATKGREGWVTIQASPLHEDVDTILKWGRRHWAAAPNMMLKIPATQSGLEAMGALIKDGCVVLATEVMCVAQVAELCAVYTAATAGMADPPLMYFAHIPGIFDEEMQHQAVQRNIDIDPDALYQAGIIVAKKIHRLIFDRKYNVKMLSGGARGLQHFTEMVGADCAVTINWNGAADKLIALDGPVVDRFSAQPSPDAVDELLEKLPDFRRGYERGGVLPEDFETYSPVVRFRNNFEEAWKKCLDYIAKRRSELAYSHST